MSDGFGYGGSYTPYDQQQAIGGTPMDAVSGGPDMFQFAQGKKKPNKFAAGGFDSTALSREASSQSNTLPDDIARGLTTTKTPGSTYMNPLEDLQKGFGFSGEKNFGTLYSDWDRHNRSIGGALATPEQQFLNKSQNLSYDQLNSLGNAEDLNSLFSGATQNLKNLYGSEVYGQQAQGKYGLAGKYADNLTSRTGNLNQAYQSLVGQMGKYYML